MRGGGGGTGTGEGRAMYALPRRGIRAATRGHEAQRAVRRASASSQSGRGVLCRTERRLKHRHGAEIARIARCCSGLVPPSRTSAVRDTPNAFGLVRCEAHSYP